MLYVGTAQRPYDTHQTWGLAYAFEAQVFWRGGFERMYGVVPGVEALRAV